MIAKAAPPGLLGFDVNQPLTGAQYAEFLAAGYAFAIRYIPRTPSLVKGNVTAAEVKAILDSGLSASFVQHVAEPGWMPSAALGTSYGDFAVTYANQIGLPKGINIWLDLEEVAAGATDLDVIAYCNAWYTEVNAAGYIPGVYVGWNVKLTPIQLYVNFKFSHYWKAYNADMPVATRGYQILQSTAKVLNGIQFDPNRTQNDKKGDSAIFLSPS